VSRCFMDYSKLSMDNRKKRSLSQAELTQDLHSGKWELLTIYLGHLQTLPFFLTIEQRTGQYCLPVHKGRGTMTSSSNPYQEYNCDGRARTSCATQTQR
jgi:hypothetical protein